MNANKLFCLIEGLVLIAFLVGCGAGPSPTAAPSATPLPPTRPPATAVPPTTPPTTAPATTSAPAGKDVTIGLTWFGQSTFVLTTSTGLKALLDPTGTTYKIDPIAGVDLVTVSHEHSDHNKVSLATGNPIVLRGLTPTDWAKVDQTIKGVRVRTVGTFHDDTQGSQRGKNAVFIFELEDLHLVHLGDLGHKLTPEQVKAIGPVQVLLIPVGGFYTIDVKTAVEVVGQLNPRIIVPMHYKTAEVTSGPLIEATEFIQAMSSTATIVEAGHTVTVSRDTLPAKQAVMVMKYK